MNYKTILNLLVFLIIFSACKKEDDYKERDDEIIRNYLNEENLTAQKTQSGLYYIVHNPGFEPKPTINSFVTVHYKGSLISHNVFETTEGSDPAKFKLSDVVEGLSEGLQLFGEGGTGVLLVPSHLGYGNSILPGVPANSVLIFDIRLIKVE